MTADDGPRDPVTGIDERAVRAHELFLSYQRAGFTKKQALKIVIGLLRPERPA